MQIFSKTPTPKCEPRPISAASVALKIESFSLLWSLHTGMSLSLSLTESGLCFIWAGKYQIKRRVLKEALDYGNRAAVVVKQTNMREREERRPVLVACTALIEIWFVSFCTMTAVTCCGDNCIPDPEVSRKKESTNRESKSKLCWGWWSYLTTTLSASGRSV